MVDAVVVAVEQPHEAGGEMTGVGGAADLVTDHDHLVLGVREPEHRVDEVTAVHAEEPGRANDEVTLVRSRRLLLAGELRLPVGRQRVGLVGLDVAVLARAVEDVVARRIDHRRIQRRGCRGHDPGARAVHGDRLVAVRLGPIDVGPGSAVDHRPRVVLDHEPVDRLAVEDVQLVVAQGDRLVIDRAGGERYVAAEHAGAACDQDLQLDLTLSGAGFRSCRRP